MSAIENWLTVFTLVLLEQSTNSFVFLHYPYPDTLYTCPQQYLSEVNLTFDASPGGCIQFPHETCLNEDYSPVIRRCYKNDTWEVLENVNCLEEKLLDKLISQQIKDKSSEEALIWFNQNTRNNLTAFDVCTLTRIFHVCLFFGLNGTLIDESLGNLLSIDSYLFEKSLFSWDLLLMDLESIVIRGKFNVNEWRNPQVLELTSTSMGIAVVNGKISIIDQNDTERRNPDEDFAVMFPTDFPRNITVTFVLINKTIDGFSSQMFGFFIPVQESVHNYFFIDDNDENIMNFSVQRKRHDDNLATAHWKHPTENDEDISGKWVADSEHRILEHESEYLLIKASNFWNHWRIFFKENLFCPQENINNLTFPKTEGGSVTRSLELCLQDNYKPVVRKCRENGTWGKVSGKCSSNIQISDTTSQLHAALSLEPEKAIDILASLTEKPLDFKSIDVDFAAKILENSRNHPELSSNFTNAVNNIMDIPRSVLKESQQILNSTDQILYSFDRFLLNSGNVKAGLSNVLVESVKHSTGFIIVRHNKVEFLWNATNIEDLDFDVALVINSENTFHLTWFKNNQFFNPVGNKSDDSSSILSILQPTRSNERITVYFKESGGIGPRKCSFWKYGYEKERPIQGHWKVESESMALQPNYYVCEFNHTTHFALILSDTVDENPILDVITIVGSVLSVLAIFLLFLTGITFRKWRENPTHKILLNVAFCLLLLIVTFYVSAFTPPGNFCIFIGIALHYLCVAHFMWTLVISVCSYRNLVQIFRNYHENFVFKYGICCWLTPVIFTGITAALSLQTYDKKPPFTNQLCYPKEIYLKYAVLAPICVILTCNLLVYCCVFCSISKRLNISKHTVRKSYAIQKSAVVFFCMMGLTWIFGVIGLFVGVFLYVFCILATLQGFIIVTFYIFGSKDTLDLWRRKLHSGFQKGTRFTVTGYSGQSFD